MRERIYEPVELHHERKIGRRLEAYTKLAMLHAASASIRCDSPWLRPPFRLVIALCSASGLARASISSMISLVAHTSGSLTREQTVELVDALIAEGDPLGQGQGWAHFERTPAASRSRAEFRSVATLQKSDTRLASCCRSIVRKAGVCRSHCYGRSRSKSSAAAGSRPFSAGLPLRFAVGLLARFALGPDPLGKDVRAAVGDRQHRGPAEAGCDGAGRPTCDAGGSSWCPLFCCAGGANGTIIVGSSCSVAPNDRTGADRVNGITGARRSIEAAAVLYLSASDLRPSGASVKASR